MFAKARYGCFRPSLTPASGVLMRKLAAPAPARDVPQGESGPAAARLGHNFGSVRVEPEWSVRDWIGTRGSGRPLDSGVRREMEARFSASFLDVRVHTDARAAATAQAISARAFAMGNHIAFAPGEYRPESPVGKVLLAHELVHTVQQRGVAPGVAEPLKISQPGDAAERSADQIASAGVGPIGASPGAAPAVARTAVGFETTSGPTWSNCGQFEWIVKWHITNVAGAAIRPEARPSSSWIVQRITNTYDVRNCSDGPGTPPTFTALYWEAFRVDSTGRTLPGTYHYDFGSGTATAVTVSGTDQWRRPDLPGQKGSWSMEGFSYWVPALNPGEFSPGAVTDAGVLPSTTSPPTGLGSATLTRTAQGTWNCCGTTRTHEGEAAASNSWRTYTEGWGTAPEKRFKTVDGRRII